MTGKVLSLERGVELLRGADQAEARLRLLRLREPLIALQRQVRVREAHISALAMGIIQPGQQLQPPYV